MAFLRGALFHPALGPSPAGPPSPIHSDGCRCSADMDGEDARQTGPDEQVAHGPESLACVTCRTRKLKCGRERPICSRCARVDGQCVYPESRRRPAFKRKNVKELEERLGVC